MFDLKAAHASHNLRPLIFLLLLIPALACKALIPSTPTSSPNASEGLRISYPTGIETIRLDNGIIAVLDHKGFYGMGFPEQWEVGAFHEDFIPTVDKYAQINHGIKSLFQTLYGKDDSLRIFAIDTSPNHLAKDNMAVLHIGMFQDKQRLQATIEELTANYVSYLDSSGQIKIVDTFHGTTNDGIPFTILLTEPISQGSAPIYSATVLIKTDKAYLEMLYTTLDKSINIVDELAPILASFNTFVE